MLKGMVRRQFILRLALHHKLTTVGRLIKWGIQVPTDCVLCETQVMETKDHLFFGCAYSRKVWKTLLQWLGLYSHIGSWSTEVGWLSKKVRNMKARNAFFETRVTKGQKCYIGVPVCKSCLGHMDREGQQKIHLKEADV